MQRCLTSLSRAGYRCLLLGRQRPESQALKLDLPFDQERHALSAHSGKRFYAQLNRAHYQRLLNLQPLAILVVDFDTMWGGARAAQTLGIPWVYDAHELFTELPEVQSRWWVKVAWAALGRRYVPRAAQVYTVGQAIAEHLAAAYRLSSVGVVRNFPLRREKQYEAADASALSRLQQQVPAAFAPLEDGEQPFTVIYQGALNDGRGLEELLTAVAQLPQHRAWIAGAGYLEAELRQKARELQLTNVHFFGELRPEVLRALTPQADVGYALMRNLGLNYYYSLSNKSIDYVHAGLPSMQMAWPEYQRIAADFPEVYTLVDRLTVPAVVAALQTARQAKPLVATALVTAAQQLCWQQEEGRLIQLWQQVIAPRLQPDEAGT